MTRTKLARAVSAAIILLAAATAQAGTYKTEPLAYNDKPFGCMSVNDEDGVILMGVARTIVVIVRAPEWKVGKDDAVVGTWSIDGGKARPLNKKANAANTVSFSLEASKEAAELITSGNNLNVTIGNATHDFDLAGSTQALVDLATCMNKAGF